MGRQYEYQTQGIDPEFKERAIRLALTSSRSISKTVRELGLKEITFYFWGKELLKKGTKQVVAT